MPNYLIATGTVVVAVLAAALISLGVLTLV
jgi:hypothetical protein